MLSACKFWLRGKLGCSNKSPVLQNSLLLQDGIPNLARRPAAICGLLGECDSSLGCKVRNHRADDGILDAEADDADFW